VKSNPHLSLAAPALQLTLSATRWTTNQAASPLLRLPPELRNRIYELVLSAGIISVHHRPISRVRRVVGDDAQQQHGTRRMSTIPGGFYCRRLRASRNSCADDDEDNTRHRLTGAAEERGMTLLAPVCRQLYRETALLPFQLNAWHFESAAVMERYVLREKRLAVEQRRAVRTLHVAAGGFTRAAHKCFGELEVVVMWYSSGFTRTRKVVVPPRHDEKVRVLAEGRQLRQAMELFGA